MLASMSRCTADKGVREEDWAPVVVTEAVEAVELMGGVVWEVTEPVGVVEPATTARDRATPPVWLELDSTELILPPPVGLSSASEQVREGQGGDKTGIPTSVDH